jgi:HSP20 family protein
MGISDLIPWRKNRQEKSLQPQDQQDPISGLQDEMNRLFGDFFAAPTALDRFSEKDGLQAAFSPSIDIRETDEEVRVEAELPGMDPEDIDVSYTGNTLTISGEKRTEKEQKNERYFRKERAYGSFRRSISLPGAIQEEEIAASFQHGVLQVNLPKDKTAREGSSRIEIKQG